MAKTLDKLHIYLSNWTLYHSLNTCNHNVECKMHTCLQGIFSTSHFHTNKCIHIDKQSNVKNFNINFSNKKWNIENCKGKWSPKLTSLKKPQLMY